MDIYSYLKKDHRKVQNLLEAVLSEGDPDQREDLLEEIEEELTLHSETEQETFYDALQDDEETAELIDEAEEDHEEVKELLEELRDMSADSEEWMELFGELKQAVNHHVRTEEGVIFEHARNILSDDEAEDLAKEMQQLKEDVLAAAA